MRQYVTEVRGLLAGETVTSAGPGSPGRPLTASFAGQQDAYLNVAGPAAVLQRVSRG